MKKKITIVGAGAVGSTIAYTLAVKGAASEIVMIDINHEKVLGEALDIRQGLPFSETETIYAGDYPDAVDSNIVIITSGIARKPGQTRLELAQTNVNILRSITPQITKYAPDAVYIIVSNPVDILTYVFTKISGIPENRIIGSGTVLDTLRLRARLAEYYKTDSKDIIAYVLGEHGDSAFVPWSMTTLNGLGYKQYMQYKEKMGTLLPPIDEVEIEKYMRTSGGKVIARKGATYYAVSMSVCHICECVFSNLDSVLTVSTMMHGEHGIEDVCLSYFTVVNCDGTGANLMAVLTPEEEEKLRHSAECLKKIIASIEF